MKRIVTLITLLCLSLNMQAQTIYTEPFTGTSVPSGWTAPPSYVLTANNNLTITMVDSVGPQQFPIAVSPAANWVSFQYLFPSPINMAAGCKCVTFDINNSGNPDMVFAVQAQDINHIGGTNNKYTDATNVTVLAGHVGPVTVYFAGKFQNYYGDPVGGKLDSTKISQLNFQTLGATWPDEPWNRKFKGNFTIDNLTVSGTAATSPDIVVRTGISSPNFTSGATLTLSDAAVGGGSSYGLFLHNLGTATMNVSSIALSGTGASQFSISSITTPTTVTAGNNKLFYVNFNPTSSGAKTATLTINSDDPDQAAFTIVLSATGLAPEINVKKDGPTGTTITDGGSTTMNDVVVGNTGAIQAFAIENTGNTDLIINSISFSGTHASMFAQDSPPTFPVTISPGYPYTFGVVFTPTSTGAKTATIDIVNNDGDEASYNVVLSASGLAAATPEINIKNGTTTGTSVVSGGTISLTDVVSGQTGSAQTITVENTGTGILTINSIGFSGTNAAMFSLGGLPGSFPATIAAGSSQAITVTFAPTSTGAKTATITIGNDDANEGTYTIVLNANGVASAAPEINVRNGSVSSASVISGGTAMLTDVVSGQTGSAQTITVENTGSAVLNINSITITGTDAAMFTLGNLPGTFPATITAGTNGFITVVFAPTSTGVKTATITIANDDANEGTYTIVLNANGVASAAPEINVRNGSVSDASVISGGTATLTDVVSGQTGSAQTITVENTGSAVLNINSITITGTDAAMFTLGNLPGTFPASIVAGTNGFITVVFAPTSTGVKTATITIANDDANEGTYTIVLMANGTSVSATNAVQALIASSKLYPNPVSDIANIELSLKNVSTVKVTLSDLMGKEIMTVADGTMSSLNTQVSVSNLNKGLYTVTYFINGTAAKAELLMVK